MASNLSENFLVLSLRSESNSNLLDAIVRIKIELEGRGVLRTRRGIVGDYAEYLVTNALDLHLLENNSNKGFDALDHARARYEIKRRGDGKMTISGLPDPRDGYFDYLAAVLFDDDYRVLRALVIPNHVVIGAATMHKPNDFRVDLRKCFDKPGVRDITEVVQAVAAAPCL